TAASSSAVRSKKLSVCRRRTISVWPAETGNASSIANAYSLFSRMRSGGTAQKGQSLFGKGGIVARNLLLTELAHRSQVFRFQMPPERRVKPDVGEVLLVVTQVLATLELLEGHRKHDRPGILDGQFIHFCHSRRRPLDRLTLAVPFEIE